jgi:trimeric autotransporter adhesin
MRKGPLLLLLISISITHASAQSIGINNTAPDASAVLDIKSTSKGLLIPRVTTTQRTAISAPAKGLLVFDSTTNSFWFYNGAVWNSLSASGSSGWSLTGNSSTNSANNFIGTTDAQPLRFRTNNVWAGEIHPTNDNTFLGINAGEANTTGTNNTAFGYQSLYLNNAGKNNTAIGTQALASNSTASDNTAVGGGSLFNQFFSNGGSNWVSGNTAIGFGTLHFNNSTSVSNGIYNTAVGHSALYSNATGNLNTALGTAALNSNINANGNVAVGDSSLYSQNGTGTNVAVGTHTLYKNTTGNANTAIGPYALYSNAGGGFNTAIGVNSLYNNISGIENTAVGSRALQFNIEGGNTATGASALRFNTTGADNTANGFHALHNNTIGEYNTSMGGSALYSNTTGGNNTAIGSSALYFQSFNNGGIKWNSNNTAVGVAALQSNQPTSTSNGNNNTAVGYAALLFNTTGLLNTATGSGALYTNTTGSENTAQGSDALYLNTTGDLNTANGANTLYYNTTGSGNTASGIGALFLNTTGNSNTALGYQALKYNVGGSSNVAIGDNSGISPGSPNATNTISIGNSGYLNAASNQAFIGNMSTTWIGGHVNFLTYSDARMKKNIKEEVKGLDFIMRLRPVTYNKSLTEMRAITGNKDTKDFPGKYDVEKIKFSGFLAQEVEKAAKESDYDFDAVHKPQNEHDLYSLSYAEFVVPLVKAMQEQQLIIAEQNKKIELLLKELQIIKGRIK